MPLAGVVVSHRLGFGVLLLLLGGPAFVQAATVAGLIILTFARTLVWARGSPGGAAHGGVLPHPGAPVRRRDRSRRRPRSGDLGVDADPLRLVPRRRLQGRSWAISCTRTTDTSCTARGPAADDGDARNPVFRLRGRDGSWRQFESVRTAVSADLRRGPPTAATPDDGVVLHLRDVAGRRSSGSSSSNGWPTPTT